MSYYGTEEDKYDKVERRKTTMVVIFHYLRLLRYSISSFNFFSVGISEKSSRERVHLLHI